jgi:hypothetical protein
MYYKFTQRDSKLQPGLNVHSQQNPQKNMSMAEDSYGYDIVDETKLKKVITSKDCKYVTYTALFKISLPGDAKCIIGCGPHMVTNKLIVEKKYDLFNIKHLKKLALYDKEVVTIMAKKACYFGNNTYLTALYDDNTFTDWYMYDNKHICTYAIENRFLGILDWFKTRQLCTDFDAFILAMKPQVYRNIYELLEWLRENDLIKQHDAIAIFLSEQCNRPKYATVIKYMKEKDYFDNLKEETIKIVAENIQKYHAYSGVKEWLQEVGWI